MENFCLEVLAKLREQLGKQNFETWIKPARFVARSKNEFALHVPNKLHHDWLRDHFVATIEDTARLISGRSVAVSLHIDQSTATEEPRRPKEARLAREPKHLQQKTNLILNYTFENFVVGASNQFANAASLAVANQLGETYNPLFIYGGVGLGKTHIINAIGHRAIAKRPSAKILYISSESFMNELIGSIRRDQMDEFKKKFRNIDLLIVDDVQFIGGKERTQEEFFHTFNSLYESHKQIVISADKFPKEIPGLEDRLRNRFEWGLIADIQPPDMETRVAILQKKAENENIPLPHDVAIFLATHIDSNVRELEGSLTRLGAFSSLTKSPITLELTKDILRNMLKGAERDITVESIQKTICDFYHLKVGDLKAKRRTRNIALPRQVAMYLCRKHTEVSFPGIGDKFGGRDHSTVIHASKTIEKRIKDDPFMQSTIESLERNLNIRK
ncbi:MAG: chromosomal replication initiator protein DnaA [Deltaproteobacteria bacterium]|nr:chromosomal replication initiator protein DnaA [Deltaproteobacteria bacterium]